VKMLILYFRNCGKHEGPDMRKINVIVMLLLLVPFCITYYANKVDADYITAQGNPQETGELLPDPNLLVVPEIEIGEDSPEFSYDFAFQDGYGEVILMWEHSAGYLPHFSYGTYATYRDCLEFVRLKQTFMWAYNQTPTTLKISASVQIACTGDFKLKDNGDDMYAIYFWLGIPGLNYGAKIKEVTDLKGGQKYDIQFLMTSSEAKGYFAGSVLEGGHQFYPNDNYTLFVGLIPTVTIVNSFGGGGYYEDCEGSVTASISHLSVKALLDVADLTPAIVQPKFNTTTLWNETYRGLKLEPMGENSFVHVSAEYAFSQALTLGRMTSDHHSIWNVTPYQDIPTYMQYFAIDVMGDSIYLCSLSQISAGGHIFILKLDSQGQELWNKSIPLYYTDIPVFVDVDTSGAMYILSLSLMTQIINDPFSEVVAYCLVKLDNEGNTLWNRTLMALTYTEFENSLYSFKAPKGLGCFGNSVYIGLPDMIQRYDADGNEMWSINYDYDDFMCDPNSGFYTCSSSFNEEFRLSKWTTEGSISWNASLDIDYGTGWQDYPRVEKMKVGPDLLLYLVLEYTHVNHVITITRVTQSGQIYSQDTIYNLEDVEVFGQYYLEPFVTDMAITGDGLVHLAVLNESSDIYQMMYPFTLIPANVLLTYELSGPMIFTVSPVAMIITGVATLMFGGIALDYFVRRRPRLKDILPEQEEIDPWKILVGEEE
jgi:hypothetical protein